MVQTHALGWCKPLAGAGLGCEAGHKSHLDTTPVLQPKGTLGIF